jgi:hypothetical protein
MAIPGARSPANSQAGNAQIIHKSSNGNLFFPMSSETAKAFTVIFLSCQMRQGGKTRKTLDFCFVVAQNCSSCSCWQAFPSGL